MRASLAYKRERWGKTLKAFSTYRRPSGRIGRDYLIGSVVIG